MSKNKTYRPRSQNNDFLLEIHNALKENEEAWEIPDSPEAFTYTMKHLMILRERIAARLKLPIYPKASPH
jgi:hypothetical protein